MFINCTFLHKNVIYIKIKSRNNEYLITTLCSNILGIILQYKLEL